MIPKEKAKELYDLFYSVIELTESDFPIKNSVKEVARICAEKLIKHLPSCNGNPPNLPMNDNNSEYWEEVKQEIEKL